MGARADMYLPVYEKIEKEIIELSSCIFFDDNLLKVYSLNIADLIIRCAIEIESLVKDIYRKEEKCEPETPGQCIKWLDSKCNISKIRALGAIIFVYEMNIMLFQFSK